MSGQPTPNTDPHVRAQSDETSEEPDRTAPEDQGWIWADAVGTRERAVAAREAALGRREHALIGREEVLRAGEAEAQRRGELQQLLRKIREANENLVLASVRAQRRTDEAEQANQLKDEMLSMVSHELRTPLSAVLGWIRMLESKRLPAARAEHALAAIGRSAGALAHMIDDLLDTSRILKGTIRMVQQPVDLVALTHAAVDAVRPVAEGAKVELTCDAVPGLPLITGDAARIEQVFWNLLANAIKFTGEGGEVAVFLEPSNGHIEIRVEDTGQGISPDFLPHVFERFRQGEDATSARHTGLGLGLGIVRQLVELHGGTVHAASPGLGQGATFTVRLPVAAGARSPAPLPPR